MTSGLSLDFACSCNSGLTEQKLWSWHTPPAPSKISIRRQLVFMTSIFAGDTFYLDLNGHQDAESIEEDISILGGRVEKFLSKDVKCVVTNKKKPRGGSAASPTDSANSTPNRKTRGSTSRSNSINSPLALSRGQALLLKSNHSKNNSAASPVADVLSRASEWGIKIVHVTEVKRKLSREKKRCGVDEEAFAQRAVKAKELKAPFIKYEDVFQAYRVNYHPFVTFPTVYIPWDGEQECNSHHSGSPFEKDVHTAPAAPVEKKPPKPPASNKKPREKKLSQVPGYCECCDQRYQDVREHLASDVHGKFADHDENFAELDSTIAKLPSLVDFVARLSITDRESESIGHGNHDIGSGCHSNHESSNGGCHDNGARCHASGKRINKDSGSHDTAVGEPVAAKNPMPPEASDIMDATDKESLYCAVPPQSVDTETPNRDITGTAVADPRLNFSGSLPTLGATSHCVANEATNVAPANATRSSVDIPCSGIQSHNMGTAVFRQPSTELPYQEHYTPVSTGPVRATRPCANPVASTTYLDAPATTGGVTTLEPGPKDFQPPAGFQLHKQKVDFSDISSLCNSSTAAVAAGAPASNVPSPRKEDSIQHHDNAELCDKPADKLRSLINQITTGVLSPEVSMERPLDLSLTGAQHGMASAEHSLESPAPEGHNASVVSGDTFDGISHFENLAVHDETVTGGKHSAREPLSMVQHFKNKTANDVTPGSDAEWELDLGTTCDYIIDKLGVDIQSGKTASGHTSESPAGPIKAADGVFWPVSPCTGKSLPGIAEFKAVSPPSGAIQLVFSGHPALLSGVSDTDVLKQYVATSPSGDNHCADDQIPVLMSEIGMEFAQCSIGTEFQCSRDVVPVAFKTPFMESFVPDSSALNLPGKKGKSKKKKWDLKVKVFPARFTAPAKSKSLRTKTKVSKERKPKKPKNPDIAAMATTLVAMETGEQLPVETLEESGPNGEHKTAKTNNSKNKDCTTKAAPKSMKSKASVKTEPNSLESSLDGFPVESQSKDITVGFKVSGPDGLQATTPSASKAKPRKTPKQVTKTPSHLENLADMTWQVQRSGDCKLTFSRSKLSSVQTQQHSKSAKGASSRKKLF